MTESTNHLPGHSKVRAIAEHPYMVLAQRLVTAIILGVASYACSMIVKDHDGIADVRSRLGVIEERLTEATADRYTASDARRDQAAQQVANGFLKDAITDHTRRIERLEDGKR